MYDHKTYFWHPYSFTTCWPNHLVFQTFNIWPNIIHRLNIKGLRHQGRTALGIKHLYLWSLQILFANYRSWLHCIVLWSIQLTYVYWITLYSFKHHLEWAVLYFLREKESKNIIWTMKTVIKSVKWKVSNHIIVSSRNVYNGFFLGPAFRKLEWVHEKILILYIVYCMSFYSFQFNTHQL